MEEETTDLTLWRNYFGKGCGPIASQTTKWRIANYASYRHNYYAL